MVYADMYARVHTRTTTQIIAVRVKGLTARTAG